MGDFQNLFLKMHQERMPLIFICLLSSDTHLTSHFWQVPERESTLQKNACCVFSLNIDNFQSLVRLYTINGHVYAVLFFNLYLLQLKQDSQLFGCMLK